MPVSLSRLRLAMATFAPWAAMPFAMISPMPPAPPITTATLPSSRNMSVIWSLLLKKNRRPRVRAPAVEARWLGSGARLDAVLLLRIDDGDDAHAGAAALGPAPREGHEGAALAGHLVQIAAD